MTKKQLWEIFMRTGRVSDYLRYKKAEDAPSFDNSEDIMTEFSQEFFSEGDD